MISYSDTQDLQWRLNLQLKARLTLYQSLAVVPDRDWNETLAEPRKSATGTPNQHKRLETSLGLSASGQYGVLTLISTPRYPTRSSLKTCLTRPLLLFIKLWEAVLVYSNKCLTTSYTNSSTISIRLIYCTWPELRKVYMIFFILLTQSTNGSQKTYYEYCVLWNWKREIRVQSQMHNKEECPRKALIYSES